MKNNRDFLLRRYSAVTFWLTITLSALFFLASCSTPRGTGTRPLKGFQENVTALVTTSVRGHLRDDTGRQELLKAQLPFLEKKATLNELVDELKKVEQLKELSEVIPKDVMFELEKPENQEIKGKLESPEIQREVVAAIILGMKRALQQLGGG